MSAMKTAVKLVAALAFAWLALHYGSVACGIAAFLFVLSALDDDE